MEKYNPNPAYDSEKLLTSLAYQRIGLAVNQIMESGLSVRPLDHEDFVGDTPDDEAAGEEAFSGQMWLLESRELGISEGEIKIAVYAPDKAREQSEMIGGELGREIDIWGHVEFSRNEYENINPLSSANAQLNGVFYLMQDGNIFLHCERTVGSDITPEETKRCYRFAKQLGLAEFWADGVIEADPDEYKQVLMLEKIDASMAYKLGNLLERVANTSESD